MSKNYIIDIEKLREISRKKAEEVWLAAIDNAEKIIDEAIVANANNGMNEVVLVSDDFRSFEYYINNHKLIITKGFYKVIKHNYKSQGFKVKRSLGKNIITISW